jgi:hypothetical protein
LTIALVVRTSLDVNRQETEERITILVLWSAASRRLKNLLLCREIDPINGVDAALGAGLKWFV